MGREKVSDPIRIKPAHPFKGWVFYWRGKIVETKPKESLQGQVLIVDDDAQTRVFLKEFLHSIGFSEVATAKDGTEALRQLEKSSFRLVLLDYMLPDLDGFELLRRIKCRKPGLPVILMTAYPDISGMEEIIKEGALDLVVKPLDLRYLEQTVMSSLAH